MESKQTAMQQLLAYIKHNGQSYRGISADMIEKEFIPMEKQQIIESFKHGNLPTFLGRVLTAEEYYTETFGKDQPIKQL